MGVSQNKGYLIGGPHIKDHSSLGSILVSPYFGKLPCSKCSYPKYGQDHSITSSWQTHIAAGASLTV